MNINIIFINVYNIRYIEMVKFRARKCKEHTHLFLMYIFNFWLSLTVILRMYFNKITNYIYFFVCTLLKTLTSGLYIY